MRFVALHIILDSLGQSVQAQLRSAMSSNDGTHNFLSLFCIVASTVALDLSQDLTFY